MADSDKKLKIEIVTAADTSGVRQASDSLTGLDDKTKKYIETLNETNKAEEKTTSNRREGREILRGLSEQFPILGEVGRVAGPHFGAHPCKSHCVAARRAAQSRARQGLQAQARLHNRLSQKPGSLTAPKPQNPETPCLRLNELEGLRVAKIENERATGLNPRCRRALDPCFLSSGSAQNPIFPNGR